MHARVHVRVRVRCGLRCVCVWMGLCSRCGCACGMCVRVRPSPALCCVLAPYAAPARSLPLLCALLPPLPCVRFVCAFVVCCPLANISNTRYYDTKNVEKMKNDECSGGGTALYKCLFSSG